MAKTLTNSDTDGTRDNVKDVTFWGDPDDFQLLCKASSNSERWMKSTKAMEIDGLGCLVQVTTQQGNNVAEALEFIPDVTIEVTYDDDHKIIGRRLVPLHKMRV